MKGFFDQSKKLVQPPKELPELIKEVPPPGSKKEQQAEQLPKPKEPVTQPQEKQEPHKDFSLPRIEAPEPPQREQAQAPVQREESFHEDDIKEFEEAINNINIDMIHSDAPESEPATATQEESKYYKPAELGEGYFSEIEHYLKNKNVHEIIDDIMKKDFLTSMKDYHDTKEEGKPFYLHKQDLQHKLKKSMNQLRRLEEEWHSLKTQIGERENKKKEIETEIDKQSQELKELFKQIKINQILEKEAPKEYYFNLVNGQKIKNLNDLRKALSYMTEDEFTHHVNQEKNDFAKWIRDVLQNQDIYERIKDKKTKEGIQEILKNPL